jgi:rsbT co-antagonist protein RsbR
MTMTVATNGRLLQIVETHGADLLSDWTKSQLAETRRGVLKDAEVRDQCSRFLRSFQAGLQHGGTNLQAEDWSELREVLTEISRSRALQGFSPTETATFVFSLKAPLFTRLRKELSRDPEALANEVLSASQLLDKIGLLTTEAYQKGREEVIARQQQDMMELSTPVVKLWEGILALPVIGTLDSARSQVVMESLLTRIVETSSAIAIIDITGVPTVDTLTAQHLIKTITAARLMGAECIISGIRPQIAQTIVHLGVELGGVVTKSSLADAFALALQKRHLTVTRVGAPAARPFAS